MSTTTRCVMIRAMLALTLVPIDVNECNAWCNESCNDLNGDVATECGACDAGWRCRPGAPGFPSGATSTGVEPSIATLDRRVSLTAAGQQAVVILSNGTQDEHAVYREHAAASDPSSSPQRPCQRITASELEALSLEERSALFQKPTLISGLLGHWPLDGRGPWDTQFSLVDDNPLDLTVEEQRARLGAQRKAYQILQTSYSTPRLLARAALLRVLSIAAMSNDGVYATPNHVSGNSIERKGRG